MGDALIEKQGTKTQIISLKAMDKERINQIANLHQLLIPESPVPKLGSFFMKYFYYSRLVRKSILDCAIYEYEGRSVGFCVYTTDIDNLFMKGISSNFIWFCIVIIIALIQKPNRINEIMKAMNLEKGLETEEKLAASILSFGVLPEFRSPRFISDSGLKISNELFESVLEELKTRNFAYVNMLIEPDNREALLFYTQYECKMKKVFKNKRVLIKATCKI